ncbi:unnamed protein product [Closterium sp. Yama58-4]|nr:unnamed protein product [Closterium sp. Yama58-4]
MIVPVLQDKYAYLESPVLRCGNLRTAHPWLALAAFPSPARASSLRAPACDDDNANLTFFHFPVLLRSSACLFRSSQVAQEAVDKALKAKLEKTHEFERTNFTGTGAKLSHTGCAQVKINFEGKYAEGPQAGQVLKGTKATGYELHLAARDNEPWKTFVEQIVKQGMGQEESKTFVLAFPADYKAKALAGIKAQFTVTVKEIGIKKAIEKDPRPIDVQKAEVEQQLLAVEERKSNDVLDAQIKAALLDSSAADVDKVAARCAHGEDDCGGVLSSSDAVLVFWGPVAAGARGPVAAGARGPVAGGAVGGAADGPAGGAAGGTADGGAAGGTADGGATGGTADGGAADGAADGARDCAADSGAVAPTVMWEEKRRKIKGGMVLEDKIVL